MSKVKPIPDGYHSVTPYLVMDNASKAIDFYKRVLGATEVMRMAGPEGKITHAELKIGDSMIMLSDEAGHNTDMRSPKAAGASTCGVFLYLEDVDAVFKKALSEGAKSITPPTDQIWGDRFGKFHDPFGHSWGIATHKEDVSPEEMKRRMQAAKPKPEPELAHSR